MSSFLFPSRRSRSRVAQLTPQLLALALALAAGCGGEDEGAAGDPCAARLDECLSRQLACVAIGGEARCEACPAGEYAAPSGRCEAIGGTPRSHEFADFTTAPGEEVLGLCQSWTLNNAEELWVNAVELAQDVASHHSNWTFVPSDQFEGPDGVWPCEDRGYSQLMAALGGGVLYAQSTQAPKETQRFPNSAALRIPPYARIIGDVHLLNTTDAPITGSLKLTLYTRAREEVRVKLVPFHLTYEELAIPPHATSRFTGDCSLEGQFQAVAQAPFALEVYYILPHYHALGTRFFLDVLGGPGDGTKLFDVSGFDSEPHGRAYDPPLSVEGAEGLRFGCEFENPRSEAVGWGFGDQEMCEVLGFAASEVGFESRVGAADPAGEEGGTQLFTGACTTLAFKWDHDKPGGPGPSD